MEMKPIYKTDFLDLFHCDNMELMDQYPDKYFNLAIVDPPYSETFNTNACADNKGKKGKYNISTLNGHLPTAEYWNELKRISKNQIIWGANWYGIYFGVGGICWFKNNTGNYSPCEYAYQSINNHVHHFKWTWNGMIQEKMANKQDRIHPTEKPTELYEWILKEFAKPNQKLLDTHFGSGSIALAVDKANRLDGMNLHLTACEIDKDYIDASIKRISQSIKQQTFNFG